MEISSGIEIIDLALYLKKEKILIIADTHIGYEEALNKQGMLVPRFQFKEIIKRLEKIFSAAGEVNSVVINGDVKHEFGVISEQEWRETLKLIDFLIEKGKKVILIKGTHDKILGPIAGKRGIEVREGVKINSIFITHGDRIPATPDFSDSKTVIIAHDHSAISLKEGARHELYKCFLKGKWKDKELIVMPSFNLVTEGTDILREELLSPFLKTANLRNFEVFIVSDKVYEFGKVRGLGK